MNVRLVYLPRGGRRQSGSGRPHQADRCAVSEIDYNIHSKSSDTMYAIIYDGFRCINKY